MTLAVSPSAEERLSLARNITGIMRVCLLTEEIRG